MFLKLLKWDLRSQRKLFILFFIYILSTVNVAVAKLIGLDWLIAIALILFVILSVTLMVAPLILLAINYYGDFYGKNAYTMHQLSVKTATIFNAKLLAGAIYMLAAVLLLGVGVLALVAVFGGTLATSSFLDNMAKAFNYFASIPDYVENLSAFGFWSLSILAIILGMFSAQVSYAFIVTFGNSKLLRRFGKVGILFSFLLYYLLSQIISYLTILYVPLIVVIEKGKGMIFRLALSTKTPFYAVADNYNGLASIDSQGIVGFLPLGSIVVSTALIVLCYIYVVHALNKKINVA